jgi:hypothetical protein
MEIQAKLSFRHGTIMRIINSHGIDIKQLSDMCGWKYQNLTGFIRFKRMPKCEDSLKLFKVLKSLDSNITEDQIFPIEYNKIKEVLFDRIETKDIPLENLLSNQDIEACLIEDKSEDICYSVDSKKFIKEVEKILSVDIAYESDYQRERIKRIIFLKCGIDEERPLTFEEIAKKVNLTSECVRQIFNRGIRKLRNRSSLKCYEPLTSNQMEHILA